MNLVSGTHLAERYVIDAPLGQGGLATVYRAHDRLRDMQVALKLVVLEREVLVEAFEHEFATLTGLFHPRLSRVHDFGRAVVEGQRACFYTADVIEGETLDRFARNGPWRAVLRSLADGLEALRYLHRAGIRHGDFKPENLLVDAAGRGTLIDLSCVMESPRGTVSGTLGAIAPEVLAVGTVDHRADLFAVGRTLERLAALVGDAPDLSDLIGRLTRHDPADRPADVDEVLAALGLEPDEVFEVEVRSQLVGREAEVRALDDLVARLVAGEAGPRAICLRGPSGVGRSRLLQEAKWRAQLRCRVVEGDARSAAAVTDLLARAVGDATLPADLRVAVEARRRLAVGTAPVLLVLDDVHLLASEQREVFDAFLRLLDPADPFGVVCASLDTVASSEDLVLDLELAGLTEAAVRSWVGDRLPSGRVSDLLNVTNGLPGEIRAVLARVRSGAEDLRSLVTPGDLEARRHDEISSMNEAEQQALGLFAALGVDPGSNQLEACTEVLAPELLARLTARSWITPEGRGFRLVRPSDAPRIARALGPAIMAVLHGRIADWLLRNASAPEQRIPHLARAGRTDEGARLLLASRESFPERPDAFRRAADALLDALPSVDVLLAAAEARELAGDPCGALTLVDRARELVSDPAQVTAVELRAGSCHLKLGDARCSLEHLSLALGSEPDLGARAVIADLECRARIQSGDNQGAADLARRALTWTHSDQVRADLEECLGVACTYLGQTDLARDHLGTAERLSGRIGTPRSRIRALSYRAILEFRVGRLAAAGERYRRALGIAEEQGLADHVATCALNLGTVAHRRGDWGDALAAYSRGLTMARAVGKLRTEVALRYDLAQIHCDIGQLERARQHLQSADRRASEGDLAFFVALCPMLAGEIELWRGNPDRAEELLERAVDQLQAQGAEREVADARIHLAEAALERRDESAAAARLDAVRRGVERSGAEDLGARIALLAGRLDLIMDEVPRALTSLSEARSRADRSEEHDLLAEVESWLSVAYDRQGAGHAARRHRERALELWDRAAATLEPHLRNSFWRHPRRAHLGEIPAVTPPVEVGGTGAEIGSHSPREQKLERLLAINARLNSSLRTREVLEYTMDAAVELTGAERGFLILAPDPRKSASRLKVAVARNLDRESIGRSSLKYSRSIAEKVLSTGEPVLSAEALTDDRFDDSRSVQAMRLKSVLSVPIRGRDGPLGALYLDNRFERGLFQQEDLEVLLGFADQVGIALANARLLDELEARTRDLERERRRIARSLEHQSREVDRLTEQVRITQEALEGRSFRGIVGRSRAMQHLFALLERVSDSTLTVLIQGESGTGKELVARALHRESPRRGSSFVTVNCAALPETLLESTLFGHRRGAFTGADQDREGLFVHAGEGTLFLDEIGEIPLGMQAKLLRALQEREVQPLGSTASVPFAARILCATNRRLDEEVRAGRFRNDLYYRLAVVILEVPPLRERLEDLPELCRHVLGRLARELGRPEPRLEHEAMRKLLAFDFPGNVRQLENLLSQAMVFGSDDAIHAEDLQIPVVTEGKKRRNFKEFRAREAAEIAAALQATRWNVTEVSRMLGIPRTSLYRKLERYGLKRTR